MLQCGAESPDRKRANHTRAADSLLAKTACDPARIVARLAIRGGLTGAKTRFGTVRTWGENNAAIIAQAIDNM